MRPTSRQFACFSRSLWLPLVMALVAGGGCGGEKSKSEAAKTPPAKVAHPVNEADLNTIRLTPEAEKHLDITTSPVIARHVNRVRGYGGEIMLPPGATTIVSAPVNGTLQAPSDKGVPQPGAKLQRRQPVFLLLPLLSPERAVLTPAERIRFAEAKNALVTSRIDAEGQVQQAQAQVDAAKIALGSRRTLCCAIRRVPSAPSTMRRPSRKSPTRDCRRRCRARRYSTIFASTRRRVNYCH